jgi:Secretion system C-terminal sorting domain
MGFAAQAQSVSKPDLSVFPNPTTEFISVSDQSDQVGFIEVFNIMGRNVKKFEFVKGERYSVADLSKGMYLVQIQDKNHKTLTTQKVEKRP